MRRKAADGSRTHRYQADHHSHEVRSRAPRQRDPHDGDGTDCESVLTQLAAVNKALSRAGYAIVATGLQQCLTDEDSDVDLAKMEKLFLALA